jgi:hypothetical protein
VKSATPQRKDSAAAWLADFAEGFQHAPDADLIMLPFPNKRFVYGTYVGYCVREGTRACSEKYFLNVWRKDRRTKKIKVLSTLLVFPVCDLPD